jgi:PTH1 family peptidyl-tRNA hydrolase
MKIKPSLIIGLGNPGKEYEKTYHNVGFLAIDYLTKNPSISNFQFPISKLLKSDVYMNQSGNFVKAALKKYNFKPGEILIVHDDSDIELGKYKISFGRGSAGHRGVESIIKSIGTKNFWRLRIGIRGTHLPAGRQGTTRKKAGELVLRKINKEDLKILNQVFKETCLKLKQLF